MGALLINLEYFFRTLGIFFLPSSYWSLPPLLRPRTDTMNPNTRIGLCSLCGLYIVKSWDLPHRVIQGVQSLLKDSGVFWNKNYSVYSSLKLRSARENRVCVCADLMHAIGLASSWLISHVVNKEEIEFKTGNNPMSEVICTISWKDSQLEWSIKRWRSQQCWIFTVSYLFPHCSLCNNEYITHYFQLLHIVM